MKEIKFKLYLQQNDTGIITTKTFSYAEIFSGEAIRELETTYIRYAVIGKSQYTGLKDKNGKEIYEGDIFKSIESNEVFKVDDIFPVHRHSHATNIGYYNKDKYNLRGNISSQYDIMDDWMSNPEFYEVIGNIYQNPELLNK